VTGTIEGVDDGRFARWWKETGEYELRQILHWKWDPIGVADEFPYAADEYDVYALPIASALMDSSTEEIVAMLSDVEEERMGLGSAPNAGAATQRLTDLAEYALAWIGASQARWLELGPLRR
jgi:hypothetical protein